MRCARCRNDAKDGWEYCPKCGNVLKRRDLFSDMFNRMRKEMKDMDKTFEKDMQFFDISPFFRQKPRGSGFTIKITRGGNAQPKVSVKTFGNVNKNIRDDIADELQEMVPETSKPEHRREGLRRLIPAGRPVEIREQKKEHVREDLQRVCEPKITEEPKCEVKPLGDRVVVEIKLPGVKREQDITINELESSVEVKAMVKDKAYFKILTKPENRRISRKTLNKGVLEIEFS